MKNNQPQSKGRGGKREGAGRKPGVPNKATACLKDMAREYTEQALNVLIQVATKGESEAARVSAANSLLDRGYGKPSTVLTGEDGAAIMVAHRIELVGVAASAGRPA